MKLTLSWRDSGGTLQSFSRVDGGTGAGGEIFPRDLAAGNNFMALHPSFGYYRTAFQHVVGSYMGEVSIGGKTRVSGAGGTARSAFVSQERWHIPSSQTGNHWVTSFTSTEVIEALTVASSPPRPDGFGGSALGGTSSLAAGPPDPPDDIYRPTGQANDTTVAVGGYFDGTASFPTTMSEVEFTASGSSEDAFVALVNFNNGLLLHHLTGPRYAFLQIGSPTGATRVTGIAIDPKDYTIAVTGWFEAANTNFDHHGGSFTPGSHAGGRDIFVALYEPNEYGEPFLKWLYVTGTQHDDAGAGVAFDSSGAVYATGFKGDAWGGGDLWMARFPKQVGGVFPRSITPAWQHDWPSDEGDVRGTDVAVDHLDRAVLTGRFGYSTVDIPTYCMDFDPGAGTDQHCTAGRSDIFVMRFRPTGHYDWGYSAGGYWDDTAAAVATEPMGTGRIAIGGTFGIGSGPLDPQNPYTIDLDPDPVAAAELESDGWSDSFASALDQRAPENVRSQVCFLLDNSASVNEERYHAMMSALRSGLLASGNVKTNGTVVLGAVVYGNRKTAIPFMPWTHIDSPQTLQAFAHRLARQALDEGNLNELEVGIEVTGEQFERLVLPGAYRHLVAIAEEEAAGDPRGAVDTLIAQDVIDQSNGIGTFEFPAGTAGRQFMLQEVAGSAATVPVTEPLEANLGMAASVPEMLDSGFPVLVDRFIKRVTVCPGDFNRDGWVDVGDQTAFFVGSSTGDPYADWNFDGTTDGHLQPPPERYDGPKFDTGWALGCGGP